MTESSGSEAGRRIAKNTGLMFGGKGTGAVLNVLVLVVVGRHLPTEVFGSLLIIHATMLAFAELGTFKSWQALIKFGVPHLSSGDTPALHRLIRFSLGLDIVSAMFAFLAAELFLWFGHHLIGLDAAYRDLAMAYCFLILARQRFTAIGTLRLLDRFDLLALHATAMPAARLVGSIIAAFSGGGLQAFVLVWAIAAVFDYIVLWYFTGRELYRADLLKGLFDRLPTLKAPETGLWRFSWTANIDSTIAVAKQELPLLLAGGVLGAAYAAVFKVAVQIASVLVKGTQQLDEVIYPELAHMINQGQAHRIWPLILRAAGILVAIAMGVGLIVAILGPDVLSWALQTDYRLSAPLATLLLFAGAISAAYAPLLPTLYAADRPEHALLARGVGVSTLLVLFVVLAHTVGELGPGIAFIIGDTLALIFAAALTQRALRNVVSNAKTGTSP
ncbi:MAG: lipopolysaccharide biosynthesis protein [Pseudomonadota bacterium]